MAKAKNITAAQIEDLRTKAEELAYEANNVREAVNRCQVDDTPGATQAGRMLVAVARDLSDAAIALFSLADLQSARAKLKE